MLDDHFDHAAGEALKAEGMAAAERAADEEWKRWFLEAVQEICRRKPYFITDDVELLRRSRSGPRPHEPRAMGPMMLEAWSLGYCEPTQDWVASRQKVNHHRPMRVWWSLLYQGPKLRRPRRRKLLDPRQIDLFSGVAFSGMLFS